MNVTPHDHFEAISRRVSACIARGQTRTLQGIVYRAVRQARAVLDTDPALWGGGRWNAPGSFRALYTSASPELAIKETLALRRRYGLPDAEVFPRTIFAIEHVVPSALDLMDGDVRQALRISRRRMTGEPWWTLNQRGAEALTQAIGRAAAHAGIGALRVPSSAGDETDANIVMLPAVLQDPDALLDVISP